MLIKLTKISFTTVGHPTRVDRVLQDPIWVNTSHIITMSLKPGPESCRHVTELVINETHVKGPVFNVLETPEQIIALISGQQ